MGATDFYPEETPIWRQCRSPRRSRIASLALVLSRLYAHGQLHQPSNPYLLRVTELLEHDVIKRPNARLASALLRSARSATAATSCVCVSATASSRFRTSAMSQGLNRRVRTENPRSALG